MQDDKPVLFESVNVCLDALSLLPPMVDSLTFDVERMAKMAGKGASTATGLAEHLVSLGTPFRDAHEQVGRLVTECQLRGIELSQLSEKQLIELTDTSSPDVCAKLTVQGSLRSRNSHGGPGPDALAVQFRDAHLLCDS
jgi:argininosuccinate lyase